MTFRSPRRRDLLVAGGLLATVPRWASAQTVDGPAARPRVVVQTGQGGFILELAQDRAPITAANFLRYVDTGRFDGASFYRASRAAGAPGVGLIEGGLQNDPAKLLAPIAHESTQTTGLAHLDGVISMARNAPGTARADFFICSGAAAYLDARPESSGGPAGDRAGYAAFGRVVQGMEVVRAILALPTPGVARNPVMAGQMLDPPVPIVHMKRAA